MFQNDDSQIHYGDQVKISFDTPSDFDGFNKNQIYLTCGNNNNTDLYIETGPGNILQGLNRRITQKKTIGFNEV